VINDRRCQLDFAKPEVRRWATGTVERLVDTYRLGWIKIDYTIDIGDRFDPATPDRAGARLYDHLQAYYAWLDELRAAHPELDDENCSSGGLRFDTGIMAHAHTTWVSDVVNAVPSLQLGWGCTLQFSPELCIHWMVGDRDTGVVDPGGAPGWWDFMFRVPMTGQFGISSRVAEWSPAIRGRAAANVALYKRIRPTITGADVYHLTPAPDHDRPTGWMALQYVSPEDGRSVLLAYRLAGGAPRETFRLRGLDPARQYDVSVDGGAPRRLTGAALAAPGLPVALAEEWRAAVIEIDPRP
jgi:alpha-galactosidase